MNEANRKWRLRLPVLFGLADLAWAASALRPSAAANEAASVGMINSVIWIFLHLPAALLGSLPFGQGPTASAALPGSELALIGVLGVAQTCALAWLIGRFIDRKRK